MAETDPDRRAPIPPQWMLLAASLALTVLGLSFCFGPQQPPSACIRSPVMTAGPSTADVGVCPP